MALSDLLPALRDATNTLSDAETLDLRVAGALVRLTIGGEDLRVALMPSLQGLVEGGRQPLPRSTIHAWTGPDPIPDLRARFSEYPDKITVVNEPPFHVQFNPEGDILSWIDTESGEAFYHVRNAANLPDYEVCTPMRMLFNWHCYGVGALMVHAASVGVGGSGVLIVGRSGAGKSTTALQCLREGMEYLGDDYVAITRSGDIVHHLYRGCKVMDDAFGRLPNLRSRVTMRNPDRGKSVVVLDDSVGHLVQKLRIVAVVRPRISNAPQSRFSPLSPLQASTEFAATTIMQMPGVGGFMLRELAALCQRVPAYEMALGSDPGEIAGSLWGLIEDLANR